MNINIEKLFSDDLVKRLRSGDFYKEIIKIRKLHQNIFSKII